MHRIAQPFRSSTIMKSGHPWQNRRSWQKCGSPDPRIVDRNGGVYEETFTGNVNASYGQAETAYRGKPQ